MIRIRYMDINYGKRIPMPQWVYGERIPNKVLSFNEDNELVCVSMDEIDSDVLKTGDDISRLVNNVNYLTGNQTINLSGDVTGSGETTITVEVTNVNASAITGTLPVNKGGTGLSSFTPNKLVVGNLNASLLTPSDLHWDVNNSRLGIGITTPKSKFHVVGDITTTQALNLGDPDVDNSWRLIVVGTNLEIQKRVSGTWVTKSTIVP